VADLVVARRPRLAQLQSVHAKSSHNNTQPGTQKTISQSTRHSACERYQATGRSGGERFEESVVTRYLRRPGWHARMPSTESGPLSAHINKLQC
jgi:hypothetical protein